ncbi:MULTISPECIES: acyl-CoA dehydrogenase family protein [Streptomyces]|uniref:Acyl-CoA dehydrogenase family protein n=1 Tax=Streptomyces dubilierae TaxID=3075533 RepID=A0ABU2P9L8_9ACTN|nr:acyl-CoA dehydrogenase family protein [Streptomyces sp. DSM 41921]MDT0387734.1 acyl-CoA dehydrogenase family protein [Streptomyces sp. DSM 41921]
MTQREEELARVLAGPEFTPVRPAGQGLYEYSLLTLRRARLLNRAGLTANSLWLGRGDGADFPGFLRTMGWIGAYDLSLLNVLVSHQIAGDALLSHGGPGQVRSYGPEIDRMAKVYCFAASELHAGSDLKRVRTTAVHDPGSRTLVLNTPSPADAKVWIGNSLHTGDVAMVLGRLEVAGRDEGHHWFRVPLREGGRTLPGVRIGRAEPKGGVTANQTGLLTFTDCRLPLSALMDRWATIGPDGVYSSPLPRHRRFEECLATFTHERLFPSVGAAHAQRLACAVTTRFAVVKHAFGAPLIGHAHYRMRLTTAVGRALAARHAMEALTSVAVTRAARERPARDQVVHALISCGKSGCTADARHTLAETRELCGGLGYHDDNQIAPLLHDYEIAVTFGGDNTVLGYQASRYALRRREDFDAVLDEAVAASGGAEPVLKLRRICDALLDRVEQSGPGEASNRWTRAVYQTLALGHWYAHPESSPGARLRGQYAAGCLLEHALTGLRAGILDSAAVLRLEETRQAAAAAPVDGLELLDALAVPEALITAPIARPDFAERHVIAAHEHLGAAVAPTAAPEGGTLA